MKKVGWDTETGYAMFIEGKKDSEIADAFGIKTSIVTAYRKRHWEGSRKEAVPLPAPVAETPLLAAQAETEGQAVPNESPLAGMVPIQELIEKVKPEQTPIKPEQTSELLLVAAQIGIMEVIEQATANLTGIQAVCTANAIQALWNWKTKEDLLTAIRSIEYLIGRIL